MKATANIFLPYCTVGIRPMIKLTLCLILSMGCARYTHAFESHEHKLLGDTAVRVLVERYGCNQDTNSQNAVCNLLTRINGSRDDIPSYGDIVMCVDYFLTPEKLIANFDESRKHQIQEWPQAPCNGSQAKYMQASHANHTHFQKELLISLNTYHFMAASLARDKQNIAGALFVNAIADHYLHDFFAPGHITVRRSQITDLFSNALHDGANKQGATFHAGTGKVFDRFTSLLEEIYQLQKGPPRSGENRQLICKFLLHGMSTDSNICNLPKPTFAEGAVYLQGDHYLGRADGYQQRIVMLAANVMSIEDVLYAYTGKETQNAFGEYEFSYLKKGSTTHAGHLYNLPDIRAELPFGYYALGLNPQTSSEADKLLPRASDFVWGISMGKEQFSTGTGAARTATTLEFVPYGTVGDGFFSNYGIAVGLHNYGGSGEIYGNGGTIRLGFIIPETETTLSVGAKRVYHAGSTVNEWGNGWNIRFDQGYSSFFSLFISVGRDFSAEAGNQLAFGTYLSAGIMLAAPTGRIKACIFEKCM